MKVWIAAIAAVAVQPVVLAVRVLPDVVGSSEPVYGLEFFLVGVIAVAAAATLLLGVPAFFALRKLRRDGWASLALCGFLIGAIPFAFSWPSRIEGYSSAQTWHGKHVELYVNGNPTTYAWLVYAENVAILGLHGAVGALAFYAVWRRLNRSQPQSTASEA